MSIGKRMVNTLIKEAEKEQEENENMNNKNIFTENEGGKYYYMVHHS